jgi:hypothetical protein
MGEKGKLGKKSKVQRRLREKKCEALTEAAFQNENKNKTQKNQKNGGHKGATFA